MSFDGSLNDLEQQFVRAHLGRCGACSAFEEDARAFTTLLRDAPLEPVSRPVTVAGRRQRARVQFRTIAQVASVASVVIAAGTIALAHDPPGTTSDRATLGPPSGVGASAGEDPIRSLRREALIRHDLPVVAEPTQTSTGDVDRDGPSTTVSKPPLPVDGS